MKKINLKKLTFVLVIMNVLFFIEMNYINYFKPQAKVEKNEAIPNDETEVKDVYLNIMTTNRIIYDMCSGIVDGQHNISMMLRNDEDFKTTNNVINNVSNMDLFLYSGKGNEAWLDNFIEKLKKGKVGIIDLSRGTKTLNKSKNENNESKDNKVNEYYYLSPDEYKISLYNVKNAIEEKDIKNKDMYEKNYVQILKRIEEQQKQIQEFSKYFKDKKVILFGDKFEYLAQYLKMDYIKIDENIKNDEFSKRISEICDKSKNNIDNLENKKSYEENYENIIFLLDEDEESDIIKKELKLPNKRILAVNASRNQDYIKYLEKLNESIGKMVKESTK